MRFLVRLDRGADQRLRLFKDRGGCPRHTTRRCVMPRAVPLRAVKASAGRRVVNAKRRLARGPSPTSPHKTHASSPTLSSDVQGRNVNLLPFRGAVQLSEKRRTHDLTGTNLPLRIASLVANHSSHETILHFGPRDSHSCNCYSYQDLHRGRLQHPRARAAFHAHPRALLHTALTSAVARSRSRA